MTSPVKRNICPQAAAGARSLHRHFCAEIEQARGSACLITDHSARAFNKFMELKCEMEIFDSPGEYAAADSRRRWN
ncbi:hypothetical protein OUZ56_002541 [Daphnia magna]|uniref:Uncharacterized protein n=1 Tax=Daphnia magna TaxID=35525 RepID=A0ABR0A601_9CRUS|nr:hypothetical protein OUZ56_002541 [Daphnia magna]